MKKILLILALAFAPLTAVAGEILFEGRVYIYPTDWKTPEVRIDHIYFENGRGDCIVIGAEDWFTWFGTCWGLKTRRLLPYELRALAMR